MMNKFLDKEPQHDVRVRVPAFTKDRIPFFGCRADNIKDDAFVIGEAISELNFALGTMEDIGDVLSVDQTAYINDLFDTFKKQIGFDSADSKALVAMRLENGRLRAKIKRLENKDED